MCDRCTGRQLAAGLSDLVWRSRAARLDPSGGPPTAARARARPASVVARDLVREQLGARTAASRMRASAAQSAVHSRAVALRHYGGARTARRLYGMVHAAYLAMLSSFDLFPDGRAVQTDQRGATHG